MNLHEPRPAGVVVRLSTFVTLCDRDRDST